MLMVQSRMLKYNFVILLCLCYHSLLEIKSLIIMSQENILPVFKIGTNKRKLHTQFYLNDFMMETVTRFYIY